MKAPYYFYGPPTLRDSIGGSARQKAKWVDITRYRTTREPACTFDLVASSARARMPPPSELITRRFERVAGDKRHSILAFPPESIERLGEPIKERGESLTVPEEKRCRFASDYKIRHGHNEIRSIDCQEAPRCMDLRDTGSECINGVRSVA